MIRIFGTMTDPSGSPVPGAIIELRAISSTSEVLLGSTVNHKCDQQGAYSFQLATGTYDAYAQNDRCGDMDYLGIARVYVNSVDGDLQSILVDGGINITPPMLDGALAAAQRAESAAALTAADKDSTNQNAESAKEDAVVAKAAKGDAVSAASTAVSAKESIITDASNVRDLATQVAAQAADVSTKHGDVAAKSEQVSAQVDVVSTKHSEVVTKAAQVSDDASATQSAKNISVAAADTATQKAASAATHDASAQDAATRAENAASAVVGAVLDGGECDLSSGVYPQPITVAGKKYSTIWYVAVSGSISGVTFDVGDLLRYTTARDGYYFRVDAKDDVYSVNGEKGPVTVTPEKIGAEKTGVAQQFVEQHASKHGAHAISSVQGLAEALAGKETAGTALSAVTEHEVKAGAHSISSVAGLREELDGIKAAGGDAVLDAKWLNMRSPMRTGYAAADGQTLPRGMYPDALAAIQAGLVPTCSDAEWLANPSKRGRYTLGDGATTFRVPDYNGKSEGSLGAVVFRGDGKNAAPVGDVQGDAIRNIQGTWTEFYGGLSNDPTKYSGAIELLTSATGNAGNNLSVTKGITARFNAARVVPTADENRMVNVAGCWGIKLFGAVQNAGSADAAALATEIAELAARVSALEHRKSTCLVNASGTGAPHETVVGQLPANISINTRYVIPNPFGNNTPVQCIAEVQQGGKWFAAGWIFTGASNQSYGVSAGFVQDEGVVVQTAKNYLCGNGEDGGGLGGKQTAATSLPCRVFVRKLEA